MEISPVLQAVAVLLSFAVLSAAAVHDVRSREVPDGLWKILGLSGSVLYAAICIAEDGLRWEYAAVPAGLVLELYAIAFLESRRALMSGAAAVMLFAASFLFGDGTSPMTQGLAAAVAILAYAGLYYASVLRGGADAKCLMALSLALPYYPEIGPFPLMPPDPRIEEFIPPSLSVLFVGAVIAAAWALIWYAVRTDRGRMRLDEAAGSFVWICSGEDSRGEEKEAAAARLMSEGASDAKVVYQIPFIAPLAIASAAVVLLGSPLFIL